MLYTILLVAGIVVLAMVVLMIFGLVGLGAIVLLGMLALISAAIGFIEVFGIEFAVWEIPAMVPLIGL